MVGDLMMFFTALMVAGTTSLTVVHNSYIKKDDRNTIPTTIALIPHTDDRGPLGDIQFWVANIGRTTFEIRFNKPAEQNIRFTVVV